MAAAVATRLKPERWNPRSRLLDPLHWRRRVRLVDVVDPFRDGSSPKQIDAVFGVILACQEFENVPEHRFVLKAPRDRLTDYFSVPGADLVQRWAKAVDGIAIVGDGDEWFSEYIEGRCSALADRTGTLFTRVEAWSHPENVFPLRHLEIEALVEWEMGRDRTARRRRAGKAGS